ncbi:hypothetical protein [Mixta gaviniae]|uniref:Colicin V synthesis protein n=1 Tax=Mixta gaviniae TaxID=665914 RepID=A0A1X1EHR4_9GAMM|nr:hypothetical protein [Mixta gaviniae]AUX91656.1 hypothetical protein C2E15_00140 [Mixta gaviniae]ORM88498.1 hypothetical protein HA44_00510 [Mixta gaviniae]
MRQLNNREIMAVSGGNFFDTLGAAILGGIVGATAGMMKAGTAGGMTGGILGVGVISAMVGAVVGCIAIGVQGVLYGMINGWDKTLEWFNTNTEQWFDHNAPLPK